MQQSAQERVKSLLKTCQTKHAILYSSVMRSVLIGYVPINDYRIGLMPVIFLHYDCWKKFGNKTHFAKISSNKSVTHKVIDPL